MSLKSKRQRFVEGRRALSDCDFLSRTSVPPEWQGFRSVAREAAGEFVRSLRTAFIRKMIQRFWFKLTGDWEDLVHIFLLATPETTFPNFLSGRFFWRKWPGPKTVGEWATRVAEHVHSITQMPPVIPRKNE